MPTNYPIFPDKYKLPALVRAEDMIEFRRKHGLGGLSAPRSAVVCLYNAAINRFGWTHP